MNGLKYDDGKPMLDLIPPEAIMSHAARSASMKSKYTGVRCGTTFIRAYCRPMTLMA